MNLALAVLNGLTLAQCARGLAVVVVGLLLTLLYVWGLRDCGGERPFRCGLGRLRDGGWWRLL